MIGDSSTQAKIRMLIAQAERSRIRRSAVIWALTGCATLAAIVFVAGLIRFAGSLPHEKARLPVPTDGVVAVTGGPQRIADAVLLMAQGKSKRLLISGINEKAGRDEIIRHTPNLAPLMACCVDLDYRARNTIGNAIEARRWARARGYHSLTVVTSNYHMPRTLVEFAHAMPGVTLLPYPVETEAVDVSRWWMSLSSGKVVMSEYIKYLAARGRMLLETDPEHSRFAVLISGRKPISPKGAVESDMGF
jgi:uncharacterized SAM-binding protein YcdF (DUF218 family)